MRARPDRWLSAAGAFVAGGFWGLGLAYVLAFECYSAFFFFLWGALAAGLGCGAVSLLIWTLLVHRGASPGRAALRLAPLALPLVGVVGGPPQPWRGPVLLIGALVVTVAVHARPSRPGWAELVLAGALPLVIYLPDVAPWVGRADTFEFQVAAPRLGVAHPSGYPLYIMVGKAFSLIPLGTVAWRVNLSSAVCAALAACCLYQALRLADGPRPVALLAAWTLAFSPTLWSRAIEAEVYALNAVLVAAGLCTAVGWQSGRLDAGRALPLLGLLAGVGIASHLTLAALLLLLLPLAIAAKPRPRWRTLLAAGALFLGGVAVYLYIPLRWPALNDGRMMDLGQFVRFVTNAESGGALHPAAFFQDPARWVAVWRLLRTQVGWPGLVFALAGLVSLVGTGRWSLATGSGAAFVAWIWFGLGFYVAEPDYSAFLVPAHVVLIFWFGLGLAWTARLLSRRGDALVPLALAAAALFPMSRLWLTGPGLDAARERADDAWGRYVLSLPLAPGAAILADSEKFPPLYYLQQSDGLRQDLDLVVRFDEAGYREELERRLGVGQTVFLARYLPRLEGYFLRSVGPLVEVSSVPLETVPEPDTRVAAQFGQTIELLGFDEALTVVPALGRRLTLYWRAVLPPERDLLVTMRLVDGAGRVVWTTEGVRPVGGLYPTVAWAAGEVVPDFHELAIPPYVLPGTYHLDITLAPPFSAEAFSSVEPAATWVTLTRLDVPARADVPALPVGQRALFGSNVWMTGYDLPAEAGAGGRMPVTLGWRIRRPASGLGPQLTWVDQLGRETETQESSQAVALEDARVLHLRRTVTVPSSPGEYELRVAWADQEGSPLPARCRWLASSSADCLLDRVHVLSYQQGLANYQDLILLVDAYADTAEVSSHGSVEVALKWRALRAIPKDYTMFIQLIGPDGHLYGQIDTWPVHGSYPTSWWTQGETISDRYEVRLRSGAPVGAYRVVVGWYLLATMQRLPVVDADGQSVADSHTLAEFSVEG